MYSFEINHFHVVGKHKCVTTRATYNNFMKKNMIFEKTILATYYIIMHLVL